MRQRQSGFTLVELMVAMAIGSVIILAAGQLFLATFQTFKSVDELSRKQENLIFIAHMVTNEIRQQGAGRYTLMCAVEQERCSCTVADQNENGQPLVSFNKDLSAEELSNSCAEEQHPLGEEVAVDGETGHLYRVSLPLEQDGEAIVFHVARRGSFFTPSNE